MKSLRQIYNTIESEQDVIIRRENKITLFSLINYLQTANKGISKYDMEHFLKENRFSKIFEDLIKNTIVKENENGYFVLSKESKGLHTSFLLELTSKVFTSNVKHKMKNSNQDPVLSLLYNDDKDEFSN
jgi:hypothetical protein